MGFVCNQHYWLCSEVFIRHGVLLLHIQVGVQRLDGGEAKVYAVRIGPLKIRHLSHLYLLAIDGDGRGKEIFLRGRVQKVVARLLHDVVAAHEEEEVSVALLVKVEHGESHYHRLARASGHVEKQMRTERLAFEHVFRIHVGKEIPHTVCLIWAQMLGWGHSCLEIIRQLGSCDGLAAEFLFNYLLKLCHNQRSFL